MLCGGFKQLKINQHQGTGWVGVRYVEVVKS